MEGVGVFCVEFGWGSEGVFAEEGVFDLEIVHIFYYR